MIKPICTIKIITLKDFGTSSVGADNEFISSSTETNDKINHSNGNSPTYYYSSAFTVTSGVSISTASAAATRSCYIYSFDTTGGGARTHAPLSLKNSFTSALDLLAVPNPNNGKASIYYGLGEVSSGEIYLRDVQGRLIERVKVSFDRNKIDMDFTYLQNGIYFITLINSRGETLSRKMILQK